MDAFLFRPQYVNPTSTKPYIICIAGRLCDKVSRSEDFAQNACYKEKILMEIYRDETCVLSNAATCSQSACRAVVTQCRLMTVHMDMLQLE